MTTKLKTLRDLRYKLQTGQLDAEQMKALVIEDTDGTKARLSDDGALAVLDRRIALEEGAIAAPAV